MPPFSYHHHRVHAWVAWFVRLTFLWCYTPNVFAVHEQEVSSALDSASCEGALGPGSFRVASSNPMYFKTLVVSFSDPTKAPVLMTELTALLREQLTAILPKLYHYGIALEHVKLIVSTNDSSPSFTFLLEAGHVKVQFFEILLKEHLRSASTKTEFSEFLTKAWIQVHLSQHLDPVVYVRRVQSLDGKNQTLDQQMLGFFQSLQAADSSFHNRYRAQHERLVNIVADLFYAIIEDESEVSKSADKAGLASVAGILRDHYESGLDAVQTFLKLKAIAVATINQNFTNLIERRVPNLPPLVVDALLHYPVLTLADATQAKASLDAWHERMMDFNEVKFCDEILRLGLVKDKAHLGEDK